MPVGGDPVSHPGRAGYSNAFPEQTRKGGAGNGHPAGDADAP